MDAEGSRCMRGGERAKKLAVLVAAQSLLVAVCLAITLYAYWDLHRLGSGDDVHIQFDAISEILANATLHFHHIRSRNMMNLADKCSNKISVNCTGPYVLYMDVCYKSLDREASGILRLGVVGRAAPLCTFNLEASLEACRGLHGIAYLQAGQEATLDLRSTGRFKIKNVTVGLSYLLGSRCEY